MPLSKHTKYIYLAGIMASSSAVADTSLFENFSTTLSMDKYLGMEEVIELDTVNENLRVFARAHGYSHKSRANNLLLADDSVGQLQADLALTGVDLPNPETQQAILGVAGVFYNADSASPTTNLGEVFVRVAIGNRGNGLEAWYELQVSTADDWSSSTIAEASLGPVELNTVYTASITYDGDNSFSIVFDNGAAVNVDGPPRMGAAYNALRYVNNRIRFGQDNSTPTLQDSKRESGKPVSIAGTVDNVVTENGLVDDFSGPALDRATWSNDEAAVELKNRSMVMRVTGQGGQETERFWIRKKGLDAFGATLTLLGSGTVNDSTRVRGRLTHYLSNDTYDVANGDTPNGWEGFIWTQFQIERAGGSNRAVVYAERVRDANWDNYDELFWKEVGPINLDQPYDLLIEKTGTRVEYRLDGALVHTFDLATDYAGILSGNDYEPAGDVESGLQARVQDDAGEAHFRFDNIVTDHPVPAVSLMAFNAGNDRIEYPDSVVVNEGEVVDLVAEVRNPAAVTAYIWEQTAGTDVVTVVERGARMVGDGPNLSFTVPAGSNDETLEFELTVLDNAGAESKQAFAMKVDNGAPSTFSDLAAAGDDDDSSGGGGGSFDLLALLVLSVLLAAALQRNRARAARVRPGKSGKRFAD